MRWCLRVGALLLAGWLLGASALPAQTTVVPGTCSPTDTLRSQRRGANRWYLADPTGSDTLRHASGAVRGFASEGNAMLYAAWLLEVTGRRWSAWNLSVTDILGCIPSAPAPAGDSLAPPPAIDSLPPEVPEQPPQDTVAPDPGIPGDDARPSARGVITCQPESLCAGDARASLGPGTTVVDSVVWMAETGTGTGERLIDFQGGQWGPVRAGFTAGELRIRTWWIVAWSGPHADTARVVWTVPVTEATVYTALPLGTEIGTEEQLLSWVVADPRDGQGVTLRAAWGTPAVESCAHVWLWAAWAPVLDALYAPGDTLWREWLPPRLASCRGVIR